MFDNYGMAHTASYEKAKALSESDIATPSTFTNAAAYGKMKSYTEVAKEKHGQPGWEAYRPGAGDDLWWRKAPWPLEIS